MAPHVYLSTGRKRESRGKERQGEGGRGIERNEEEAISTEVVMEVRNVTLPRVGQCRR